MIPIIPKRANAKKTNPYFDRYLYKLRHLVENMFARLKHEEVYLKAYDTVKQAKQSIAEYLDFYNTIRPHSSLNKATPNEFYDRHLPKVMAA